MPVWTPRGARARAREAATVPHRREPSPGLPFRQPADEPPPAAELADGERQLVAPLLQWKVDRVVLRIDDAEKPGIAEPLGAPARVENLPVQEDAHVVAVADEELLHLIAVRIDDGSRVDDLHAGLGIEPLREVALERHPR